VSTWPSPERLVAPHVRGALAAALAGDLDGARTSMRDVDDRDPLATSVVRLVRGLEAVGRGDGARAHTLLLPCTRERDASMALVATQALVDERIRVRRFAPARLLVRRLQCRLHRPADALWLDAMLAWIDLHRRGTLPDARLVQLESRLERAFPAAVHALVHLLRAEHALLAGRLVHAVAAQREARPYVQSARWAVLTWRHDALVRTLRAPYCEVEDWEEPLRPVSREEIATVEARDWQLWIDLLHRRVVVRTGSGAADQRVVAVGRDTPTWNFIELLARAPGQRLGWSHAVSRLGLETAVEKRAAALAEVLHAAGVSCEVSSRGFALSATRYVFVFPSAAMAPTSRRILAELARRRGASAADLESVGAARRTVQRHLATLRGAGYLRQVGGGSDARYALV